MVQKYVFIFIRQLEQIVEKSCHVRSAKCIRRSVKCWGTNTKNVHNKYLILVVNNWNKWKVIPLGFKPKTFRTGIWRSIQLSYGTQSHIWQPQKLAEKTPKGSLSCRRSLRQMRSKIRQMHVISQTKAVKRPISRGRTALSAHLFCNFASPNHESFFVLERFSPFWRSKCCLGRLSSHKSPQLLSFRLTPRCFCVNWRFENALKTHGRHVAVFAGHDWH